MSEISRVGRILIGITGGLALVGVLIQIANVAQSPGTPTFAPSSQMSVWQGAATAPPRRDYVRGAPAARYYLYTHEGALPVFVSVARADTLDAYRAPYLYLLDEDGRLLGGNEESYAPRAFETTPLRVFSIMQSRSETVALLHWTQTPGQDPVLDPTDSPALMFGAMLTKKPLYLCDVWTPIRSGSNFELVRGNMVFLADAIDRQIKTLPKN